MEHQRFVTVSEVSKRLGVSLPTAYRLTTVERKIPFYRFVKKGSIRIQEEDLEQFIADSRNGEGK